MVVTRLWWHGGGMKTLFGYFMITTILYLIFHSFSATAGWIAVGVWTFITARPVGRVGVQEAGSQEAEARSIGPQLSAADGLPKYLLAR
jgi:hypothetical protein